MGSLKRIIRVVNRGNTAVVGMRGRGKDMLLANVVIRRGQEYISNVDYGLSGRFHKFDPMMFDVHNNYKNFISGKVSKYIHPYPDGLDVYISDAGVYFPATYHSELSRAYSTFPTYMCLSRQIADSNVIINAQVISHVWDKIRSQCDSFINCDKCLYLPRVLRGIVRRLPKNLRFLVPKLVIQRVTIYDNEDSCVCRREPFLIKPPLLAKREVREMVKMQKLNYTAQYGHIDRMWLVYFNKSDYNTRIFKEILENGD